jgi:hypothetical protein
MAVAGSSHGGQVGRQTCRQDVSGAQRADPFLSAQILRVREFIDQGTDVVKDRRVLGGQLTAQSDAAKRWL